MNKLFIIILKQNKPRFKLKTPNFHFYENSG